jgi:hypothetical protein
LDVREEIGLINAKLSDSTAQKVVKIVLSLVEEGSVVVERLLVEDVVNKVKVGCRARNNTN